MSEGFRGVITGVSLATGTGSTKRTEIPESDRPVYYSQAGLLAPRGPICRSGFQMATITSDALAKANTHYPIWNGSHLSTFQNAPHVPVYWLDPRREFLLCPHVTNDPVWIMPSATDMLNYLKLTFGDTYITAGFSWTITVTVDNHTAGDSLTIQAYNATVYQGWTPAGFNQLNGTELVINGANGVRSAHLTFVYLTTKPGQVAGLIIAH
jgi:hypothetical protein